MRATKKRARKNSVTIRKARKLDKHEPFQIIIQGTVQGLPAKERKPYTDAQERLIAIAQSFDRMDISWGVRTHRRVIVFAGKRIQVEE